jgi:hypothetical protein
MKIRSITYFTNPTDLEAGGQFIAEARRAFTRAGYEVQTVRLATPPFPTLLTDQTPAALAALAKKMESAAKAYGFDYVSLGPALPEAPASYGLIPAALAETQIAFFSGLMTRPRGGVDPAAVQACAEVIHQAAPLTPDGFANLRFAALANVPPGAPFFPAAYHQGAAPAFALATEAADLAVEAFSGAPDVAQASQALQQAVEQAAAGLTETARALEAQFGARFGGLDFSLAPFPERALSLGAALEGLGAPAVGLHGSLAAAAVLAEAVDRASFLHAGFSGLMLPVLEDAVLAQRAADGSLTVMDLLLYSAVCGTGLDTVPLPGATSTAELAAVLLDLAALAQRLDKPLTARLMPIPGKAAGEPTAFTFSYFANSRVLPLRAAPLGGALAHGAPFSLQPRAMLVKK